MILQLIRYLNLVYVELHTQGAGTGVNTACVTSCLLMLYFQHGSFKQLKSTALYKG